MKRWQLCHEIDNVCGGILACARALEVFRFSVRAFGYCPEDVSARFAKETKKLEVNKFGRW